MSSEIAHYVTAGTVHVQRRRVSCDAEAALDSLVRALDTQRGLLLSSRYEAPGRYTRYDVGFVNPPLVVEARAGAFVIRALNSRGEVLLGACHRALEDCPDLRVTRTRRDAVEGCVIEATARFSEEERTRRPSTFSLLRCLREDFAAADDAYLGLYGAFGYDLALQLEPLEQRHQRSDATRDLVLYLPDELVVVDHARGSAQRLHYEFTVDGRSTATLPGGGERCAYAPDPAARAGSDHGPGEYEATVRKAIAAFRRGDLFEVTPSQCFVQPCAVAPSRLFRRLQRDNPAPYGVLANLGGGEFLIGASPEMYVRVQGRRVESCPIAGTIARGDDALGDAEQVRTLLASDKDAAELTMCTDVDRNDKARICEPGSVAVLSRRHIELYSRLIHTADHIEGTLRAGYDALDALATHCWAVTVTGAPKPDAMQFIEDHERSPRAFYGGAVGAVGFDGSLNTGLTLRTIHLRHGRAEVRVGATLLFDSVPEAEAAETRLKASALLDAIEDRSPKRGTRPSASAAVPAHRPCSPARVLLIDHRDSFVHTLADYFRQAGAEVVTLRAGFDHQELDRRAPQLVVLSPGPGRPSDFGCGATLGALCARRIPVFGVCLGLQAMVEYFGGALGTLPEPVHGKPSRVHHDGSALFDGLPRALDVGRYHALFARAECFPSSLRVTAHADDGCVMAVEHRALPLYAVQFHPESILSSKQRHGQRLVGNVLALALDSGCRRPPVAT